MATIPLVASTIKPIEPTDVLGNFQRLQQLRGQQQQQQIQAQAAPYQQQILEQNAQQGQMQTQQMQQSVQDQQAFRQAMQSPELQGKSIGQVADALAQKGAISPTGWQAAKKADLDQRETLQKLDTGSLDNAAKALTANKQLYESVMNSPDEQVAQNWQHIASQYDAIPGNNKRPLDPNQPLTKDQLSQFGPMLALHQTYVDDELARREKETAQKTAESTLAEKQAAAQFYQQNGGAPGVPTEAVQQADWLKKNPGKGPSDYVSWKAKQTPNALVMGNMFGNGSNGQPDAGLDLAAQNYRLTGQLPAGLTRSPGSTKAIIDRAAQLDSAGGGQGIAANKLNVQSLGESLKAVQKNASQVQAFENTALKNMDLLDQTAQKIPDLGAKFANVPVRMLTGNMIGTANMAAFKTALATAQTEAAKVLNSNSANGVLSDSARHELQDLIDGNATYPAIKASLDTLKADMKNRTDAYGQQIIDLQSRIKGAGTSSGASPSTSGSDPFAQFGGKAH